MFSRVSQGLSNANANAIETGIRLFYRQSFCGNKSFNIVNYVLSRFNCTSATTPRSPRKPTQLNLQNLSIEDMVYALTPTQKKSLMAFCTGNMSFGSIGLAPHMAIAEGVNRLAMAIYGVKSMEELKKIPHFIGPFSQSGEGGELAFRNNTIQQSLGRQIASGHFGVNGVYLAEALIIEEKANQGGKGGLGGQVDGSKVTPLVAEARLTVPGITLVSPPQHHDIYSVEDFKQKVHDIRSANPYARISVKLAASDGIGVIAVACVKCGVDIINIAGPGGTGSAPTSAKFEFVHPWEKALAEVHQTLTEQGLRDSVRLTVSGTIQTGLDVFKALLLGANTCEVGSSVLVSLGCIMAEVCHNGTCPSGIATNNQTLIQEKFKGTPEDVARSLVQTAVSLSDYLVEYGFTSPEEAVGRTDLLQVKNNSALTGLNKLLYQAKNPFLSAKPIQKSAGSSYTEQTVIWEILKGEYSFTLDATNQILSFGARMAYHSIKDDAFKTAFYKKPVEIRFNGLACGQSFGFIAPANLTLIVDNANDGTGKSLDGGTIYVKNQAGNITGFGATRGNIFVKKTGGRAGIRNSGAHIVVEEAGADVAEFMTGGSFTLLGNAQYYPALLVARDSQKPSFFNTNAVGPNFASGFSGGKVFLPQSLYQEMRQNNYLSASALEIVPQALNIQEINELILRLKAYRQEIQSDIVDALLKLEPKKLGLYFTKLSPVSPSPLPLASKSKDEVEIVLAKDLSSPSISQQLELLPKNTEKNEPVSKGLSKAQSTPKDACGTGVLCARNGKASRKLVSQACAMLARMSHRGATGIDPQTGDGCGITWYDLDSFFQKKFAALTLQKGHYAILHIALPPNQVEQQKAMDLLNEFLAKESLSVAGTREVPVNSTVLGYLGQQYEPDMQQCVILKPASISQEAFDRQLIRTHLRFEFSVHQANYSLRPHIISASSNAVIYKSMTKEDKFDEYFLDFQDESFQASAACSHARFSTNTLPSFMNVQMFRNLGNNGENNALQQIIHALTHDPRLKDLLQVDTINLNGFSDSHILSIFMDMLRLEEICAQDIVDLTIHPYNPVDRSLPQLHNLFGVPFEGPNASIVTIGSKIIVVRDRNGFRPQRGVINDELFYCGSELGAVDMSGEVFELPPATPLIIDLDTRTFVKALRKPIDNIHLTTLESLMIFQAKTNVPAFTEEELEIRKWRAGLSEELENAVLKPLMQDGKDKIVSMGDQRPVEALISGTHFDIGAFFKGKFAQITNPPKDPKRERDYMSLQTVVGKKPPLHQLGKQRVNGVFLDSPVVNNQQLSALMSCDTLISNTLACVFPIEEYEDGLTRQINLLCEQAVSLVEKGTTFLVLSDLSVDDWHAAIPPFLIAGFVHDALLKAGLRRQVSLGVQAGSMLTGRDVAQAISIGGADVVNPYLPFIPTEADKNDLANFNKRCKNYQTALSDEILSYMGRVGISTISAYRGTKAFNAYGINEDLAAHLGVHSDLGGVGLCEIATMIRTRHKHPDKNGLGRLDSDSDKRSKVWDVTNTRAFIERARGKQDNSIEARIDRLKIGAPRGQFFLRAPNIWTAANPMPVCILGGGAAGFYQARALLDSGLPLHLIMIEKNLVNRIGLVGLGVAPDHVGTKNQGKLLRSLLNDPRVRYFGGIEVGKDVTFDSLKKDYPCIIDCRGAPLDVKLTIPGESSAFVVPASRVYRAYNNEFNPLNPDESWPFFSNSKNPELAIIGSGNVAADIARVFLKSAHSFKKTTINPRFLANLETNPPDCVHIFSRSGPHKTKISLSELKQLQALPDVSLTASFDEQSIGKDKLSDDEKVLYDFFMAIKDNKQGLSCSKTLHFHFGLTPKAFIDLQDSVELVLSTKQLECRYRVKAVITAVGHQAKQEHAFDEVQVYGSGWVRGQGGTLSIAESSANFTCEKIKDNFLAKKFHHKSLALSAPAWQLASAVGNQELQNILSYLDEGKPMETIDDYLQARQYGKDNIVELKPVSQHIQTPEAQPNLVTPLPIQDKVIVYDESNKQALSLDAKGDTTLLQALMDNDIAPPCQCGGEKKCGECTVVAIHNSDPISKKEETILEVNGQNPERVVLSCAHLLKNLSGSVFLSPKKQKQIIGETPNKRVSP